MPHRLNVDSSIAKLVAIVLCVQLSCADSTPMSMVAEGGDTDGLGEAARGVTVAATRPNIAVPAPLASSVANQDAPLGTGSVTPRGVYEYRIPIQVPAGRLGMAPQLALQYRSDGRNGIMGMGWSVTGGSEISRCAAIPASGGARRRIEGNNGDSFCMDGQQLVLMSGTHGQVNATYRAEVDTFARVTITAVIGSYPSEWKVEFKDGRIGFYRAWNADFSGVTRRALRADGTVVSTETVGTFWPLRDLRDRAGNTVLWNYTQSGDSPGEVGILDNIQYTLCNGPTCPYVPASRVQFVYEARSESDRVSSYFSGINVAMGKRLQAIIVQQTGTFPFTVVREYRMTYRQSLGTKRTLLDKIQLCDGAGACMPATTFSYRDQLGQYTARTASTTAGAFEYTGPLVNAQDMEIVAYDADGDGNDDVLLHERVNGAAKERLIRADGEGFFGSVQNVNWIGSPCGRIVHMATTVPIDLDSNGRPELVHECDDQVNLHQGYRVLGWDDAANELREKNLPGLNGKTIPAWPVAPGEVAPAAEGLIKFGDLDGDGLPDMMFGETQSDGRWKVQRALATSQATGLPQVSYGASTTTALRAVGPGDLVRPAIRLVSQVTSLFDQDGDGHLELTQTDYDARMRSYSWGAPPSVVYRLHDELNNQTATQTGTLSTEPNTDPIWESASFQLGGLMERGLWYFADINGDGLKDGLYREEVGANRQIQWRMRINTGNGYLPPVAVGPGSPALDAYTTDLKKEQNQVIAKGIDNGLRIADMNGDGRDDIVLLDPGGTRQTHASGYLSSATTARVLYSNGAGFDAPVPLATYPPGFQRLFEGLPQGNPRWPMSVLADIDGNGTADLVEMVADQAARRRLVVTALTLAGGIDLMIGVSQNATEQQVVEYDDLSQNTADTHTPSKTAVYPLAAARHRAIVSRHTAIIPGSRQQTLRYRYEEGLTDVTGRGFLGFKQIHIRDGATDAATEETFDLTPTALISGGRPYRFYHRAGHPSRIERRAPGPGHDSSLSDATGTVPEPVETWTPQHTGFPQYVFSETTRRSLDRSATTLVPYVETVATYDTFGNPTVVTTTMVDPTNGATTVDGARVYTQTTTTTFSNDSSTWLIGKPTKRVDRMDANTIANPQQLDTAQSENLERTMAFQYDNRGLLTRVTREPKTTAVSSDQQQIVAYVRDDAGVVTTRRTYASPPTAVVCTSDASCATGQHCLRGAEPDGARQCFAFRPETFQYDTTGVAPEGITNALGHVHWKLYDKDHAWLYAEMDANNVKTVLTRDGFGRVRQVRTDTGELTTLVYEGRILRETTSQGTKRAVFHDAIGRPALQAWLAFDDGAGVAKNVYDALGNAVDTRYSSTATAYDTVAASEGSASSALGTGTSLGSRRYDAVGRPTSVTKGSLETSTYAYGSPIGKVTATDARGLVSSTLSDVAGRAVALTQNSNGGTAFTTTYGYGCDGFLSSVKSAADGIVERFTRDKLSRPTAWRTAQASTTSGSTERWRLIDTSGFDEPTRIQRDDVEVNLAYDALGRLTQRSSAGETQTLSWDENGARGLLGTVINGSHRTAFGYDKNRLIRRRDTFADGSILTLAYAYDDSANRLSSIDYPESSTSDVLSVSHAIAAGPRIFYTYKNGQLRALRLGSATGEVQWEATKRHAFGMPTETRQGALITTLAYDANTLRMSSQSTAGTTSGPAPNQTFSYYPNGTLRAKSFAPINERFDYDGSRDFLRTYSRDAGTTQLVDATFSYGSQGITTVDTTRSTGSSDWPIDDETYTYNASNAATRTSYQLLTHQIGAGVASSYTYDAAGRVTEVREGSTLKRRYTWGSFNLPTQVENFGPNLMRTFAYSGMGDRVSKKQDTDNQVWYLSDLYEARNLSALGVKESVFRLVADGQVVIERAHTWGGTTTTQRHVFTDPQGSPVYEVTGTTSVQRGFFPFGKRMGTAPAQSFSQLGYTGHRHDDDLGLINMNGRIYDIRTRRFLTRDAVADGMFTTFGTQAYSYVTNNPTSFVDPSGFQSATTQGNSTADSGALVKGLAAAADARANAPCTATYCFPDDIVKGPPQPITISGIDTLPPMGPPPPPPSEPGHGQSAGRTATMTPDAAANWAALEVARLQVVMAQTPALTPSLQSAMGFFTLFSNQASWHERAIGAAMLVMAIGAAFLPEGVPAPPEAILFRGDTRAPVDIFQTGFHPRGDNGSLEDHVFGNTGDSGYVATTSDLRYGKDFAGDGWLYYVRKQGQDAVPVNAAYGNKHQFAFEHEWSVRGPIAREDIYGAARVDQSTGKIHGFIKNPNWSPGAPFPASPRSTRRSR